MLETGKVSKTYLHVECAPKYLKIHLSCLPSAPTTSPQNFMRPVIYSTRLTWVCLGFTTGMASNAARCVFVGADKGVSLLYEECSMPEISDGEILAKVRLATICGSDLHTISGKRKTPTPRWVECQVEGKTIFASLMSDVWSGKYILSCCFRFS